MAGPAKTGSLEPFQLLGIMDELSYEQFTGVMRLRVDTAEVRVFLEGGEPRYCIGSTVNHSFAAHLLRQNIYSKAALRPHLATVKERKVRLEDLLLESGEMSKTRVNAMQVSLSHFVFGDTVPRGPMSYRLEAGKLPPGVSDMRLDAYRAFAMWVKDHDTTDHPRLLHPVRDQALSHGPRWEQHAFAFRQVFGEPMLKLAKSLEVGTTPAKEKAHLKLVYALITAQVVALEDASKLQFAAPAYKPTPATARKAPDAEKAPKLKRHNPAHSATKLKGTPDAPPTPEPEKAPPAEAEEQPAVEDVKAPSARTPAAQSAVERARAAIQKVRDSGVRVRPNAAPSALDGAPPPPATPRVVSLTTLPTAGIAGAEVSRLASLLAAEGLSAGVQKAPAGRGKPSPARAAAPGRKATGPKRKAADAGPARVATPPPARKAPPPPEPGGVHEVPTDLEPELPPMELADEVIEVNTKLPGGTGLSAALADAVAAAAVDEKRKEDEKLDTARKLGDPAAKKKAARTPARVASSPPADKKISASRNRKKGLLVGSRLPPIAEGRTAPDDPTLAQIFEFRTVIQEKDHFAILGVGPGVPLSTAHQARIALSERYDPTSYMGTYMPPEIRDDLDVIQKGLDMAFTDLAAPEIRVLVEKKWGKMSAEQVERYFAAHELFRTGRPHRGEQVRSGIRATGKGRRAERAGPVLPLLAGAGVSRLRDDWRPAHRFGRQAAGVRALPRRTGAQSGLRAVSGRSRRPASGTRRDRAGHRGVQSRDADQPAKPRGAQGAAGVGGAGQVRSGRHAAGEGRWAVGPAEAGQIGAVE